MPTHLWGARRRWIGAALAAAVVGAALTSGGSMASAAPGGATLAMNPTKMHPTKQVCARPSSPKRAACMAVERTDVTPHVGMMIAAAPSGFGPAALQSAYALPSATAGSGQTVAIVDAYDDPSAEADLATYRSQFGLPACTTANGCFRKVDQRAVPLSGPGRGLVDRDFARRRHGVGDLPECHILLVEATTTLSTTWPPRLTRRSFSARNIVSNSYAGAAKIRRDRLRQPLSAPRRRGHGPSGDGGYGVEYPAARRL